MTDLHTIRTTFHTALLSPLAGLGVLVLPSEPDVVLARGHLETPESLHLVSLVEMVAQLAALGYEIPEADELDEDAVEPSTGGVLAGHTPDGRSLVMLTGEPIARHLAFRELVGANDELTLHLAVLYGEGVVG